MDKTKIIVVEDNIVYCEFVCNLLAREGFRTVQAFHLSTARKLLQQAADGDIVVSDLRLPDGDGIDLLRWMRKEGMTQPFIIMTDYAEVHTASPDIPFFQYGTEQRHEFVLHELFGYVVQRTEFHAFNRRMHFGIVGHDDERLRHTLLAHPAQQVDAVTIG